MTATDNVKAAIARLTEMVEDHGPNYWKGAVMQAVDEAERTLGKETK